MKAIGTLMDTIFDHFMTQAVILLVGGVALGVAAGTLLYFAGLIWLASVLPNAQFAFHYPVLQVALLSGVYLLIGYFSAQQPIYSTVHETPIDALNPDVGMKVKKHGFLDSFGLPFRIATKATGRRIKGTRRTALSLFLSFSLASLLWIGGGIVDTTTDAYISRSMGTNVIAVGNPDLLAQYYDAYSLTGSMLNESFSFIDSSCMVPSTLIADLEAFSGVSRVEQRLVDYTTVSEIAKPIWNENLEQWELIGDSRVGEVLVVGLDWDNTVSDWYYYGYETNSSQQVWVGGGMANTLFEDPLIQSLGVHGSSFEVKAIAFDVINGGNITLMDISIMQQLYGIYGISESNLVLVQVDDYSPSIISRIQTLVSDESGFGIFLQQEVLENNLETLGAFWSLLQPLPLIALLSAFLSLMNYLLVSVFGRFRDYVIMRSIGAKPSFIARIMIAEGVEIGLIAGLPAVLVATLFSIYFLVPEAAVPSLLYLPAAVATMLVSMLIVVALSTVPVFLIFMSRRDLRVSEFAV
jgi:ABC-type antimicrobial peptide transport system permease subunit